MKLPPFGSILTAYQQNAIRLQPTIYIFTGQQAFQAAKAHLEIGTLATCLPYGQDFNSYDWPIKNQKVILTDAGLTTIGHLKRFSLHLIKLHPRILCVSSHVHQFTELILDTENFYVRQD